MHVLTYIRLIDISFTLILSSSRTTSSFSRWRRGRWWQPRRCRLVTSAAISGGQRTRRIHREVRRRKNRLGVIITAHRRRPQRPWASFGTTKEADDGSGKEKKSFSRTWSGSGQPTMMRRSLLWCDYVTMDEFSWRKLFQWNISSHLKSRNRNWNHCVQQSVRLNFIIRFCALATFNCVINWIKIYSEGPLLGVREFPNASAKCNRRIWDSSES